MIPPVAFMPAPGPAASATLAGPDITGPDAPRGVTPPLLGAAAVTAAAPTRAIRLDPFEPPTDPAPLKGLGIPPLNTRQVGDFDKLDNTPPLPPPGGGYAPAQDAGRGAARLDLRR